MIKGIASLALATGLCTGCYNTKMMEITNAELDSVKTVQQELLQRLDVMAAQMEADREERTRTQAENSLALQELRDVVETLSYRIDENSQLIASKGGVTYVPTPIPTPHARTDSAAALPDSLGVPDSLVSSPGPPDLDPNSEADRLFKGAYMDLTLGNYDLAVQGFKNYLVRYPDAPNAASARYYLGESYYAMSRYLEAVAEYQTVVRDYSSSRFVPSAYLKSGMCYNQLEERQLADRAYRELISRYPRTEEAEQARIALQEMGG